jgi:hypothetical protein
LFESIPYEVINIKDTVYNNEINLNANKTIISNDISQFELQINKLKTVINEQIQQIEIKQQKELKDLKAQLKVEFDLNKKLYEKLKTFET